jgi:hypothetical protein
MKGLKVGGFYTKPGQRSVMPFLNGKRNEYTCVAKMPALPFSINWAGCPFIWQQTEATSRSWRYFVRGFSSSVKSSSIYGSAPIHYAVIGKQVDMIKYLKNAGLILPCLKPAPERRIRE